MNIRLFAWPFMAGFELVLLFVCWAFAFCLPSIAVKIAEWAIVNLPDSSWYVFKNHK